MTEQTVNETQAAEPGATAAGSARHSGEWYWVGPAVMVACFVAGAAFLSGTCF